MCFVPSCVADQFLSFQVICSVLQVLNQIIKDNTEFQENACLVGLVSALQI